jgi:stage IV sporulation protein FB
VRWSLQAARIRGVPIRLHATFLVLVVFLVLLVGARTGGRLAVLQIGLLGAVIVCVVLHELGHALVARRYGIRPLAITLYPFGGVARFEDRPTSPGVDLRVAAAGPAVNLALSVALLAAAGDRALDPAGGGLLVAGVAILGWANLLIAGFNLLPVFPLDGGRMLRAVLQTRIGWARATVWTASAGQVAAFVLVWVGVFQEPWLILAGLVILPAANSELRRALVVRQLERRPISDLHGSRFRVLPADATAEQLRAARRDDPAAALVLRDADRFVDLVLPDRADEDADDGARPRPPCVLSPDLIVDQALARLDDAGAGAAVVVDEDGLLVSVLTATQLRRSLAWREGLRRGGEDGRDHVGRD